MFQDLNNDVIADHIENWIQENVTRSLFYEVGLKLLKLFCEVCKFNNISRAAEHLYISPSATSMETLCPYRLHIHYLQKILETCNENRINVMKTDRDNVLCQFF